MAFQAEQTAPTKNKSENKAANRTCPAKHTDEDKKRKSRRHQNNILLQDNHFHHCLRK